MSEGGEPNLQVATKPGLPVATKPNQEKMHELAHVVALKLQASSEEANQTPSVAVDQGAKPSPTAAARSGPITQSDINLVQSILDEIGKGQILVVPSSLPMQSGNSAICIGNYAQVALYQGGIDIRASSYDQSVDVAACVKKLAVDTILVSESVLSMTPIKQRGVIYHEFGHTKLGRTETAAVFAHELNCLLDKYPKEEVIKWVNEARGGLTYYETYAHDPGLKDLTAALRTLGFQLAEKKTTEVPQAEQKTKATKVGPGSPISGPLKDLKKKAGTDQDPPADLAKMESDSVFEWAGWTWEVRSRTIEYKIEVVKSDREGFRARTDTRPGAIYTGTPEKLQSQFKALKPMPPGVNDLAIKGEFTWHDTTWALASKTDIHEIKVVSAI